VARSPDSVSGGQLRGSRPGYRLDFESKKDDNVVLYGLADEM
jgi:hypothetical protein